MEIIGDIKNYHWGKVGDASEVAKLFQLNCSQFVIDNGTPYAELWMGDHASGPSTLKLSNKPLSDLYGSNASAIGCHSKLPFLFKVLSIQKGLSIQVHPNKAEAERLNAERPDVYKDDNHKPELAIALTPFDAMCGFRPYEEIINFCEKLLPLKNLLGGNKIEAIKQGPEGLKVCFEALVTSPDDKVATCIQDIADNYVAELKDLGIYETFVIVNQDFPGDVGVLCLCFFNVLHLSPGEAIYLPANEPHAYLKGDCVECMACSDNTIRAGLTPKYKDVDTLIKMLNYEGLPPEKKLFKPIKKDDCLEIFIPEVKDFAVAKINIPSSLSSYQMKNEKFGSIILVLQGERKLTIKDSETLSLQRGSIVFIPGNVGEHLRFDQAETKSGKNFIAYSAMFNSFI